MNAEEMVTAIYQHGDTYAWDRDAVVWYVKEFQKTIEQRTREAIKDALLKKAKERYTTDQTLAGDIYTLAAELAMTTEIK